MLFALLLGIIAAIFIGIFGKFVLRVSTFLPTLIPLVLFGYFVSLLPAVNHHGSISYHYSWVKSIGVNLDFHLDGLAILFALIITGIGTLVFFYAGYYMKSYDGKERFFAFLSLFMAAMLGLVLSDNVITLFIFWELTSISSFFLIGFNHRELSSRKSAMQALAVTGLGGLFLLGFAILAYFNTDTMSIQEMLYSKTVFVEGNFSLLLLSLLLVAAFTKSAQFPFHFWLPGAMKAPTPVSTYLHSATMVKAGVYLLLRFSPHFEGLELWHGLLIGFGAVTMLYAAIHTLFRKDMKSILAYSTIAALGILIFLIGLGGDYAITTALLFILVHALYKAALFLVTGIVDKQTGSRDVSTLSGLRRFMLPVALAGFLAALSSAGLPGTIGFIGKDLIYESTLLHPGIWVGITVLAVVTNALMVYAGFAVGIKPFFGKPYRKETFVESPSIYLWIAPAILAVLCVLFGLLPHLAETWFIKNAANGLQITSPPYLKIWHGFNTVLLLSLLTLAIGTLIYLIWKPNQRKVQFIQRFQSISPQVIWTQLVVFFDYFAHFFTRITQNGYLRNYVLVIVVVFVATVSAFFLSSPLQLIDFKSQTPIAINDIITVAIMVIAIAFTVFSQSRLAAIAGLGIVGYAMCFIFVFFSAPDLAMTQFTIDTLTVILFVLVLYRLPKYLRLSNTLNRWRDGVIALVFGGLITLLVLEVMMSSRPGEVSQYYVDNAYVLAKGKNIVNVILVDFRGFDTLIEVVVLSIAAIGVFGLLKLHIKRNEK
jgi:multicomponent Na+:H+ antiporter subunit A